MTFRLENKFSLSISDFSFFKKILIDKGMVPLHKSRIINSIYFDNLNFDMYHQSEEGILPRKKIRIRWYDNLKNFFYEKKISSYEGRFKENILLDFINSENEILKENFNIQGYGFIHPKLKITYCREYFVLRDIRLTFDSCISYINLVRPNLKFSDDHYVIEAKTPYLNMEDYVNELLPYSTSRFSKYCRGLSLTS